MLFPFVLLNSLFFFSSPFRRFLFFLGSLAPANGVEWSCDDLAGRGYSCCDYFSGSLDRNGDEEAAGSHEAQTISQYGAGFHIFYYSQTRPGLRLSPKLLPEHDGRNDQTDGSDQMPNLLR